MLCCAAVWRPQSDQACCRYVWHQHVAGRHNHTTLQAQRGLVIGGCGAVYPHLILQWMMVITRPHYSVNDIYHLSYLPASRPSQSCLLKPCLCHMHTAGDPVLRRRGPWPLPPDGAGRAEGTVREVAGRGRAGRRARRVRPPAAGRRTGGKEGGRASL